MIRIHAIVAALSLALANMAHADIVTLQGSTFSLSYDTNFWGNDVTFQGNQITFDNLGLSAVTTGNINATTEGSFGGYNPARPFQITATKGNLVQSVTDITSGSYSVVAGPASNSSANAGYQGTDIWFDGKGNYLGLNANEWSSSATSPSAGNFSATGTTAFFNSLGHPSPVNVASLSYGPTGSVYATGRGSYAQLTDNTASFIINTTPIPEPSTYALFGVGALSLLAYRNRAARHHLMP